MDLGPLLVLEHSAGALESVEAPQPAIAVVKFEAHHSYSAVRLDERKLWKVISVADTCAKSLAKNMLLA